VIDQVAVLRALAHPVRWGILERLAAEPGICACDFTEFFDVSQPTISAHLKTLREAGLVTTQRRGNTICYMLAPGELTGLAARLGDMAATAQPDPASPGTGGLRAVTTRSGLAVQAASGAIARSAGPG